MKHALRVNYSRPSGKGGVERPCFVLRPRDLWFDKSWKPGDFELVK